MELTAGATPVDFAYALHTDLGHRCRGARVDGQLVPLDRVLKNGEQVDIITVKTGGPSRDWLSVDAGYLQTPRARAKVRAWFNAMTAQATIEKGREAIERVLLGFPGMRQVAACSVPNQLGIEEVWVGYVGQLGVSDRQLQLFCQDKMPPPFVPCRFVALSELPQNEMGKVDRFQLIERLRPNIA